MLKKLKTQTYWKLIMPIFICSLSFSVSAHQLFHSPTTPLSEQQKIKFSQAKLEEITDKNFPEIIKHFDYQDADLVSVIRAFSRMTGKNFILDPAVSRGKITVLSPSPMTVAQAYRVFLSALAMNNYTVVPVSGTDVLKIRKVNDAITDSIDFYY